MIKKTIALIQTLRDSYHNGYESTDRRGRNTKMTSVPGVYRENRRLIVCCDGKRGGEGMQNT